ncbi:MAG: 50S ribosome-binding GTPase [Thermoleophilia bacterium]|nr:50S ribosome-binding GTPase [Thermoleophilia bacterium]
MSGPPLTIGTAGHVDHGKTALVRALTGRDTDRLPAERARGLTIEPGFAPCDLPSGRRVSLVDVPGHERFVRHMIAGASGVDGFLLCVAADDGVMPQTREHLDVLGLLGISRGVAAVTRADLADPEPAVGTTNRTRIADYARAAGPGTRAILRVHPSNFRQLGFTEEAGLGEMAALAAERGLALIDDLGSGSLAPWGPHGDEPDARTSVAAGASLVCFSADKLLGGPQAGILVGTREAVAAVRTHPLMRALRLDKLRIAALEATLALHRDPAAARRSIPALAMLADDAAVRADRARALAEAVGGEAVETVGRVGGGALPLAELPSAAVALDAPGGPDALAARLRRLDPPVAARVHQGRVLLDVLALSDSDRAELPALVARARG